MKSDLSWCYKFYFKKNPLIINTKVTFYHQVLFEILEDDNSLKRKVKLRVGDIIKVLGGISDDDNNNGEDEEEWFAKSLQLLFIKIIMMIIVFS